MPALTITDVGQIVREFNGIYQPKGQCFATPRRMKQLLEQLQEYTDEVQWARNKYKALGVAGIAFGPGGIAVTELLGGGDVDVAQWRRDMANWQYRLGQYQLVLDGIPKEMLDTPEGCREIYPLVTAPLLDGIYYQVMPGIVLSQAEKETMRRGDSHCPAGMDTCVDVPYRPGGGEEVPAGEARDHPMGHSLPKPPDVVTPFSLGNQIIVYQDFQRENFQRFIDDLIKGAKDIVDPDEWPWWVWAAIVAGGGLGVGLLGLYVYQFLPKAPARAANPKRSPRQRKISAIVRSFPRDSKSGRGKSTKLMLTGDVARAMGAKDYTTVVIGDLSDEELDRLHTATRGA
ncbi:MAG: hypothetical protein K0U16_07410 [Gammaproteobacteria bacterium]|nr:hypothetical protein [Gammaproteobacteria bacterium]